jgi:hypothetical protein
MRRIAAVAASAVVAATLGLGAARLFAEDAIKPAAGGGAPSCASALDVRKEKVRTLLKLQGADAMAKQTLDAMLEQFRQMPGLPEGFVDKFKEKADVAALMELSVPSYVNHLDDATLDATIAFYESEGGRKLSAQMPAIQTEAMAAGNRWGVRVATEVMRDLQRAR